MTPGTGIQPQEQSVPANSSVRDGQLGDMPPRPQPLPMFKAIGTRLHYSGTMLVRYWLHPPGACLTQYVMLMVQWLPYSTIDQRGAFVWQSKANTVHHP